MGDTIRIRAFQARLDAVHLDVQSVTGQYNAGFNVDDPGNFLNRSGYRRSKFSQKIAIIGIQLDFDRLWHRGKVADEILHQLSQLDLQARNLMFHPLTDIVHYGVDIASRERFQTDEEIAGIGLGQSSAEL